MRTGIATVPLDYGRCPAWLFEKMKRLSRGIIIAIVEEFGPEEVLKRFSDPVWFQSLGCVIGFDYNSSGLTTTTLGALKEGLRGLENELGIFVCGGKGKTSRKTPEQIQNWGEFLGWSLEKIEKLIYASKISAKVDSSLIQAGYQIYHHNFIFTKSGKWNIIQQGMNIENQTARRYHWLSSNVKDFTEEPHTGIASDIKVKPLNLVAKESKKNKEISTELVREEPKTFLKDIKLITKTDVIKRRSPLFYVSKRSNRLIKQKRMPGFCEMELNDVEFHWHPVLKENFDPHTFMKTKLYKYLARRERTFFQNINSLDNNKVWGFDLKRLEKTIFFAHSQKPENFEKLLALKGVGPKTIRALSLVSELIYGAKPSYEDPARYSFAHGGKDGTPYFVEREIYDKTLDIIEKGIKKSQISIREKNEAKKRLMSFFHSSIQCAGPNMEKI